MILHLDAAFVVALIVSTVIPLLSSLLARAHWPGEIVGILTLALATANGFFAEWADAGSGFDWRAALGTAVLSFLTAVAARYGLWKGTATDAAALAFPAIPTAPAKPDPFAGGLRDTDPA